jgi:hypothetical protein
VAFIEGEGKEVSTGAVVSGRGGAVLEHRNLFQGRAAILADAQNADIIVLSPTFVGFYFVLSLSRSPLPKSHSF